ncbi:MULTISPECIES: MATE family efflux transporter [Parabacteroides]|uniref:MATE family efflux transporter n=1 Tax=Parabacteroides TaxID=375288 RepID=UPI000F006C5E|nr:MULTISPECIES: MATE family efflux transporter [Parabacteroides]RHU25247.1 MATE family efflux transporter [Parabacteroides sp. TM07-1AC]WFE85177.1 MATE family efflux transporter [Parabacteroides chongii]
MYTNKQIWNVSYPIFLSLLAQNIINVTDTAFLGRVGEVELGASAMGGLYYICVFTIAFGFSTGSQIVMARRNGERRYKDVGPVMIQGVFFLLSLAAVMFALSRFFAGDIMRVMISSDTILMATEEFLDWRVFGFFFSFVNVMFRALFIGITRTKVLTLNAIVMALTNVLLDYLLIFGKGGFPEMGIKGAAIASVAAEGVSIVFFLVYTRLTVDIKKYALNQFRSFDVKLLRRVLDISIFTMLQYFISLSTYFLLFVAVEHLGQRELAVANIVRSVYIVLLIPVNSLSTATNSFVSNSIGAGHKDQVIPIIRKIAGISLGIVAVCVFIACIFPSAILSIYTNDASLVQASIPSLYVISGALLIAAVANIVFNGVTGTGNTRSAFAMEVVTLIFYTLFIYVAGMRLHLPVAICFLTEVIYYSGLLLASVIYLKKAAWQNKKI